MPDDVRRYGIVPAQTWRKFERQRRELLHHVARRIATPRAIRDAELAIRRVDVAPLHESIGEPGGVAQQISHRHGPLDGRRLPCGMVAADEDALIAPRRNELVHW